ncbi:MAG TPA: DUF3426 domain-containing protein [Rhizomicrobium sp.]|jgi:predicted Zn finger-like uncharacterized protein|nr:DUF3426 domain-containing protein [Rhizomicrobium sp.]
MIVTCPQCATRYRIAENKFPPGGKTVRCTKCGRSWVQQPSDDDQLTEGAIDAQADEGAGSLAKTVRPKGQRLAVVTAFLGLVGVAALIVWGLLYYRDLVASIWPQSAALYRAVGVPPQSKGVLLTDVTYHRDTEAGLPVLTIRGTAVNTTLKEMTVPQIKVTLSDSGGRSVDHWVFSTTVNRLSPGQKAEFVTRRIDPPATARRFQVSFTQRHK